MELSTDVVMWGREARGQRVRRRVKLEQLSRWQQQEQEQDEELVGVLDIVLSQ